MRLTRRTFIMASGAAAGWLATGCATTMDPAAAKTPVTSAFVPRAARPSAPAKGDWVASTCQGCGFVGCDLFFGAAGALGLCGFGSGGLLSRLMGGCSGCVFHCHQRRVVP